MNYHSPKRRSRLTTKCQVTIPKEVREALGLKALDLVDFEFDDEGNARLLKADDGSQVERKKAEWLNRLGEVRSKFKLKDEVAGMGGLECQRWIGGDGPEV